MAVSSLAGCNDDEDDANAVLCVQRVSILMADGVCSTGEGRFL